MKTGEKMCFFFWGGRNFRCFFLGFYRFMVLPSWFCENWVSCGHFSPYFEGPCGGLFFSRLVLQTLEDSGTLN